MPRTKYAVRKVGRDALIGGKLAAKEAMKTTSKEKAKAAMLDAARQLKVVPHAKPKSAPKAAAGSKSDAKPKPKRIPLNKIKNPHLRRHAFLLRVAKYMKRKPTGIIKGRMSYLVQLHRDRVGGSALTDYRFNQLFSDAAHKIMSERVASGIVKGKLSNGIQCSQRARRALNNVVYGIFRDVMCDAASNSARRLAPTERNSYVTSGKAPRIREDDIQDALYLKGGNAPSIIARKVKVDLLRYLDDRSRYKQQLIEDIMDKTRAEAKANPGEEEEEDDIKDFEEEHDTVMKDMEQDEADADPNALDEEDEDPNQVKEYDVGPQEDAQEEEVNAEELVDNDAEEDEEEEEEEDDAEEEEEEEEDGSEEQQQEQEQPQQSSEDAEAQQE
jgi:hypothetical protein